MVKVYWLKLVLGIIAAVICLGYGIATDMIRNDAFILSTFMNSLSLAIVIYLISHYLVIKRMFALQVEKPQKLFTMGIGVYFLTWIVLWVLLYSIIAGPPPPIV